MLTPHPDKGTTLLQVVAALNVNPPDARAARLTPGDVVLVETHGPVITAAATATYDEHGNAKPLLWLWRDRVRRTA